MGIDLSSISGCTFYGEAILILLSSSLILLCMEVFTHSLLQYVCSLDVGRILGNRYGRPKTNFFFHYIACEYRCGLIQELVQLIQYGCTTCPTYEKLIWRSMIVPMAQYLNLIEYL